MKKVFFDEELSTEQFLEDNSWQLHIKRDDLIHPIVSGNKWRKLKYAIQYIQENDIEKMTTFGGAFSNHTLACACVCALYNIELTVITRGEKSSETNHYQQFMDAFKANVIYVSREQYRDKEALIVNLGIDTKTTFVMDEGGKHELAHKGCMEIVSSLKQHYDAIFLASGTGTTALGIAKAIELQKLKTTLFVVPVLKNELEIEILLKEYRFVTVIYDAHQGGYAKTNKAVFDMIDEVLLTHGIMLDPIYTAKAYLSMLKEKENLKNKKVLFLHTGGTFGLFSKQMIENWGKPKG